MNNSDTGCHNMVSDSDTMRKPTLNILLNDPGEEPPSNFPDRSSQATSNPTSVSPTSTATLSPTSTMMSTSPLAKSPWSTSLIVPDSNSYTGLMGSLIREEGHIYSVAASADLLYTGSESKNIRVWKGQKEFSSFKSNSGLVKAIIISGDRIFSGHQDGKVRIWKASRKDQRLHKRIGSLPTFKARMKNTFSLSNYWNSKWVQHTDAISCLSMSEDRTLLYSASWDRTFKVWRLEDSKCLETIRAHEDAVNAIVAFGFDSLVFTGSADGTVRVWRREVIRQDGKDVTMRKTKHYMTQMLLKQECAVTSLAVDPAAGFLYCGSSDGMVNFWERRKVLCHGGVLKGHRLAVLCLAVSGKLVFSGSADTNICVWRREEGRHVCLSVLIGHTGPVKCLAAVEEENVGNRRGGDRRYTVYSGGIDKSVKIWRVTTQATVDSAEGDMLTPARRRGEIQHVGRLLN